jgi:ribosomal protein L29
MNSFKDTVMMFVVNNVELIVGAVLVAVLVSMQVAILSQANANRVQNVLIAKQNEAIIAQAAERKTYELRMTTTLGKAVEAVSKSVEQTESLSTTVNELKTELKALRAKLAVEHAMQLKQQKEINALKAQLQVAEAGTVDVPTELSFYEPNYNILEQQ